MRNDIAELIARVEGATGPDRELDHYLWAELVDDREIVERDNKLLGRNRKPPHDECIVGYIDPGEKARNFTPFWREPVIAKYTASLDASIALVERMLPDFWIEFLSDEVTASPDGRKIFGACVEIRSYEIEEVQGQAATRPLAVLSAGLRALIEGDQQ